MMMLIENGFLDLMVSLDEHEVSHVATTSKGCQSSLSRAKNRLDAMMGKPLFPQGTFPQVLVE